MRALVTGGAGFIGRHLVDALVGRGDDVVVLDDLSSGSEGDVNAAAELIVGDVAEEESVRKAIDGCELVFHQAARRAVSRSVEDPLETDRVNVAGTLTVLVAARHAGVRRVVNASSSSVYGQAGVLPTPESAPLLPHSPYAVSKVAAEQYARTFCELFGLETVSLRYFNVYGPRQPAGSAYAQVVPLFVDALRSGRAPEVHGDGTQSRDFTHVTDVVAANLAAACAPAERCAGRSYNIGGGQAYSLLELLAVLGNILDMRAEPVHTEPRPGDVGHTLADISAAMEDLGYRPAVDFESGLRETVAWFG